MKGISKKAIQDSIINVIESCRNERYCDDCYIGKLLDVIKVNEDGFEMCNCPVQMMLMFKKEDIEKRAREIKR